MLTAPPTHPHRSFALSSVNLKEVAWGFVVRCDSYRLKLLHQLASGIVRTAVFGPALVGMSLWSANLIKQPASLCTSAIIRLSVHVCHHSIPVLCVMLRCVMANTELFNTALHATHCTHKKQLKTKGPERQNQRSFKTSWNTITKKKQCQRQQQNRNTQRSTFSLFVAAGDLTSGLCLGSAPRAITTRRGACGQHSGIFGCNWR